MKRNIAVPLDKVEAYLNAFANPDSVTADEQALIALELHKALVTAHLRLKSGLEDANLTVCQGRMGYADPEDVKKMIAGVIPRLTLYRKKKDTHNMRVYFKHSPSFYKAGPKCKTSTRRTGSTSTAGSRKRKPSPSISFTRKPKTKV